MTVQKTRIKKNGFSAWAGQHIFWLYFPISLIWMECVNKVWCFDELFNIGLVYTILFSVGYGILLTAICSLFSEKVNRIVATCIAIGLWLFYGTHAVYYKIFQTCLTMFSMQGAGDALTGFWRSTLRGIWQTLPVILLLAIPWVLFCIFKKKWLAPHKVKWQGCVIKAAFSVIWFCVMLLVVRFSTNGVYSSKFIYYDTFQPVLSANRFGYATMTRLDLSHLIFGFEATEDDLPLPDISSDPTASQTTSETDPSGVVVERRPNILDIDFAALAANETDSALVKMHSYFAAAEITYTNDHTGIYEGYNLIYLTCEAFSPYAIDPVLTPTLYKMQQEGYNFTNFYTPSWGVSTSDGEYVNCTGLVPKSGVWSMYRSGSNYMPFCLGNLFMDEGYDTYAFHNNTYTYYKRDISHPNMGYIYKAKGNGLDVKGTWPESDLEMMQLSMDDYINADNFHVYYMTVSGHMDYTYYDNAMASKNKAAVADLDASLAVKAYYACNIELDKAMEYLLQRLNEAGIAEKTVIAMAPDHYPYGLTTEQFNELAGREVEQAFELYEGVCLLYCQGQEPVTVDTLACSMDILPTLCNMFNLPYDSRLMMGRDIFSDAERVVIFSNYSWITVEGKYDAKKQVFYPNEGSTADDAYIQRISSVVSGRIRYSARILENDYFAVLFPDEANPCDHRLKTDGEATVSETTGE